MHLFRTLPALTTILAATLALSACDRPTVVNVPPAPAPVAVPGPAGPTGATGSQGAAGESGSGTTVIVMPPASAPASN